MKFPTIDITTRVILGFVLALLSLVIMSALNIFNTRSVKADGDEQELLGYVMNNVLIGGSNLRQISHESDPEEKVDQSFKVSGNVNSAYDQVLKGVERYGTAGNLSFDTLANKLHEFDLASLEYIKKDLNLVHKQTKLLNEISDFSNEILESNS